MPITTSEPTDPYANDTAPNWDGTADNPSWSDLFSVEELAAALDLHAAKAAKRGDYGASSDLSAAASALRDLDEKATPLGVWP